MSKTLNEIAKELGLNIATVSRAINKETEYMVKGSTREKIFNLIKKKGFKPNIKARDLKKQKLTNFSLILPVGIKSIFYDEYYNSIIKGLNETLLNTEYSLVILPVEESYNQDEIYSLLFNTEIAGLILSPYCRHIDLPYELLKRYAFPIVSIDNEFSVKNVYNIVLDHQAAGYLGAKVLWEKGYRDMVLISDSKHSAHSEMRKKGFNEFIANKKDIRVDHIECPFSYASGPEAVGKIEQIYRKSLGVFSLNDEIAVGIINNLGKIDVKCPEDIGVLGFDGLPIDGYLSPRLSSIAFPLIDIGKQAGQIIIEVLDGMDVENKILIQADLKEGESC